MWRFLFVRLFFRQFVCSVVSVDLASVQGRAQGAWFSPLYVPVADTSMLLEEGLSGDKLEWILLISIPPIAFITI